MKRMRVPILLAAVVLFGFTTACQRDDRDVRGKLDQINQRLAKIEQTLQRGGGPGAARPMRRPQIKQPDPNAVYAAPIAGAPYEGPKAAKVTIVEAFDFA